MRTAILPVLALAAACGDNLDEPATAEPEPIAAVCHEDELVTELAALPSVSHVIERACGDYVDGVARCFELTLAQPIDHTSFDGTTFGERMFLIHRGCDRPTVVADWGYSQDIFFDDELTVLFDANALWLEHRYQGESVPAPAEWDWRALTIENGARDMHAAIDTLKHIYGGTWVSTGASKGGITATYHRYFFPDDVDGSVPYVAPASRSRVDTWYQVYLTTHLPEPCASKVRDAQVAALTSRRTMMLAHLGELGTPEGDEPLYLDMMSGSFDWAFWQYYGLEACRGVPTAASSDDAFWSFFAQASGFTPGDEQRSNGALDYEWLTEQGFAFQIGAHVAPLLESGWGTMTMEDQFRAQFPDVELPSYDGSVTRDVRDWVEIGAKQMLLIYGEYDPWSGGALPEPQQPTAARYFVPHASHGAQIGQLAPAERTDALARAAVMFGEPPQMARMARAARAANDREAVLHGMRLRGHL